MAATAPVKLNNGTEIPALGYGTWQAPAGVVGEGVKNAIKAGFRHIDCAKIYRNEKEVGDAIQDMIKEGVVKREDLYITTKLWNTDHDPAVIFQECQRSLERLQVGYLDLYLIHWPVSHIHPENSEFTEDKHFFPFNEAGGSHMANVPLVDTWHKMEELVEAGLTKSIGISNFNIEQMEEIVAKAKKIKPVTNQVEVHPALPQRELAAACKKHGIVLTAYCPLAIGMNKQETGLHENEEIKQIAKEASIESGAELLLRWNLQQGNVVLSKSTTPSRIAANAKTQLGGLEEKTLKALEEFGAKNPARVCDPPIFYEKPGPFFV